ncbi:MAG: hypothetical protein KIT48_12360 [Pseudolabrys sp.]|nr:hypothetical protein [Pseudolabrys sp.]
MQSGRRNPIPSAEPPGIDELSERLSALATRIDTLNGGRRPTRQAAPKPTTLIKALVTPKPEPKSSSGQGPRRQTDATPPSPQRDPDGRLWPRIPAPQDIPAADPRERVAELEAMLRERDQRIANLTGQRDQQTQDLQRAREQMAANALTLGSLHELAQSRDGEVAELTRRLLESESDKAALESRLATALRDANHSMVRLVNSQSTLNDQSTDLAESKALIEDLRAQLEKALTANAFGLAQAESRLQRRFDAELKVHTDAGERRLVELQALVNERDGHVAELEADKAALVESNETLSAVLHATRADLDAALETVAAKDKHIAFLDTVLKVTRDNAEATMRELVAEFDRERAEYAAKAQAASALQHDIVRLLPRLLERRTGKNDLPPFQAAPAA